ncbi:exocyst complex component EXO70B1-like isoform X1 [Vigna radiata var. radiata]|uniref:Exocyst subunit Exo70 family protein n=1 Tax=Vigna radiata var. radiata TaxID=3916 RepID=A0A1S3T7S3_VIGRR|nr:exocyst complex component EXO70B1-like isoform X1 [Vigna radiata var. radiata]
MAEETKVQLMKIKLWLITVGAGFTYSLLQLRHHPRDTQGENLQLQNQNHVIIQVDDSGRISSSSPVIMEQQANADVGNTLGTSPEDGDLIQSNSTSQNGSVDYGLVVQQQLINCIKELEKVNQMLVPMVCSHVDKYLKAVFDSNDKDKDRIQMLEVPDPDVNLVMDALPFEIISRLKEIVKLIVEGGFTEECSDIYSKWRKEFVEQCRRALGLQFQTPNDEDVEKWLKTCKATSKILFLNESRLCDYLFSGLSVASDAFFDKVCKEVAFDPVSFVDTTMKTGNLLNILFNVPKILESLHELQLLFLSGRGSYVPDIKYVQYILVMLKELGNFIFPNNEQAPVINGGLHRITKKAMRYILDKSKHIRNSLFWMGRMIELLESQLESQSKDYYADPALGSVFMINNLMYIQQEAHDLKFDDDWFRQHTAKVIQSLELYLRSSWNKMVDFLKVETNELAEADMVAELMKEKLNLFNLHFEETCTIQSTWTISDKGVKELIIESIEEFLLPEYGEFYNRFLLVFGNQAYHYIKFGFEDIKSCLSHLFFLDDDFSSR